MDASRVAEIMSNAIKSSTYFGDDKSKYAALNGSMWCIVHMLNELAKQEKENNASRD